MSHMHQWPPNVARPAPMMDETTMLARLRAQVEFYFSPQNLSHDTFLRSLLEKNDNHVPVETIANFPKVRELHAMGCLGVSLPPSMAPPADPALLVHALEGSHVVMVSEDGKWISPRGPEESPGTETPIRSSEGGSDSTKRSPSTAPSSPSSQATNASSAGVPTHPIQGKERTTIIVRDVPEGCTVEEIVQAFTTDSIEPKSANLDVGNLWYVHFATEQQAIAAISMTRDRTIQGEPIRAGIKSERSMSMSSSGGRPQPQSVTQPRRFSAPVQQLHVPQQYAAYQPMAAPGMYAAPTYDPYAAYGVPVMMQQQQQQHVTYAYNPVPQQPPMPYPASAQEAPPPAVGAMPPPPPQQQAPIQEQQQYPNHQVVNIRGQQEQHMPPESTGYVPHNKSYKKRFRKQGSRPRQSQYHQTRGGRSGGDHHQGSMERDGSWKQKQDAKNGEQNNRDTDSPMTASDGSSSKGGGRRSSKNKRHDRRQQKGTTAVLSHEHFPELGNKKKSSSEASNGRAAAPPAPKEGAYAKALLNSSREATPKPSDGETQELEQSMSKMTMTSSSVMPEEMW